MGAIEDVRKVIQDLVAPELKSLHIEIQRVDETSRLRDEALSAKIDNVSEKIDRKFELVMAKMEAISAKMEANQAYLIYSMNIEKRVEAIERKNDTPMQAT
jgi:hypothetical protein